MGQAVTSVRFHFVVADDRPSAEPGLRIAIASLARHCPGSKISVFASGASEAFGHWMRGIDGAELVQQRGDETGWDVKPSLMLQMLEQADSGEVRVTWIDSDVVLRDDLRPLLTGTPDTLVATEESPNAPHRIGAASRATGWGLEVGRDLGELNSSVLSVTTRHLELLLAWRDMLTTPDYRAAQGKPFRERDAWYYSDQDALAALLASKAFAHVPTRLLRQGRDIVQHFGPDGWQIRHRLLNLVRSPCLVHHQGRKPWLLGDTLGDTLGGLKAKFQQLQFDVSPYGQAARRVEKDAGGEFTWLHKPSTAGRMLKVAGFGSPAIAGIPLVLLKRLSQRG